MQGYIVFSEDVPPLTKWLVKSDGIILEEKHTHLNLFRASALESLIFNLSKKN